MLSKIFPIAAASVGLVLAAAPALAQHVEGDTRSVPEWLGRVRADPGTFWLDSNEDREIVHYSSARDVRLCLPRPTGVSAADRGYPLRIRWDQTNEIILHPGNCLFFDARRVTVSPAADLPAGVVLQGSVEASHAVQS